MVPTPTGLAAAGLSSIRHLLRLDPYGELGPNLSVARRWCLCSSHTLGSALVSSSSCSTLGWRPSRMASTTSGASERQAEQAVDEAPRYAFGLGDSRRRSVVPILHQPLPPMRPRECADQRSRPGVGLAGAHASPPSGAMITLRPPRRLNVIGMWTVIVLPSKSSSPPRDLPLASHAAFGLPRPKLLNQRLQPPGAQSHPHAIGRQVDPIDQQPDDPRLLGREQLVPNCPTAKHRTPAVYISEPKSLL